MQNSSRAAAAGTASVDILFFPVVDEQPTVGMMTADVDVFPAQQIVEEICSDLPRSPVRMRS